MTNLHLGEDAPRHVLPFTCLVLVEEGQEKHAEEMITNRLHGSSFQLLALQASKPLPAELFFVPQHAESELLLRSTESATERSPSWVRSGTNVFLAKRAAVAFGSTPLLPVMAWYRFCRQQAAKIFLAFVLCICFSIAWRVALVVEGGGGGPVVDVVGQVANVMLLMLLAAQASTYSRDGLAQCAATFEFWFLAHQRLFMLVSVAIVFSRTDRVSHQFANDVAFLMCDVIFFCALDASPFPTRQKGIVVALYGLVFALDAAAARLYTPVDAWRDTLDLGVWNVSPLAMYQSSAISLFLFCLKFFARCTFLGADTIMLPCQRKLTP